MRPLLAAFAAAAVAVLLAAGAAGAATFSVVTAQQGPLPSYRTPNAPGSLVTPRPLDRPPASPRRLSYDELLDLWRRAGAGYGVPWQVLAAINKIESNFGQNMGPSSAGALGWMQFIPDSWQRWGMDADGDGVADPWNPEDGVYAAARYLAAAGAHDDLPRAIFAYNHAQWYVDDVLELAELFGSDEGGLGGLGLASPGLDSLFDLRGKLADARRKVTRARTRIPALERRLEALAVRKLELERKAGDPRLSEREFLALEGRIAGLALGEERARLALERRRVALEQAELLADSLRREAEIAAAGPAPLGAAPAPGAAGYVFPVGGGPELVSVAHDHHDYPAADIAAPQGSPLYALADSVVVEAYPEGNGKCGFGFKLQVESGAVFVYCHLSVLDPAVVPGAALAAGAPVGLVGSTGHSTGPHLHLAFVPALAYPQEEAWFESFAGTAFRWQDAPTPAPAPARAKRASFRPAPRVFEIVEVSLADAGPRVVTFTR